MIFLLVWLSSRGRYHCLDCGDLWKEGKVDLHQAPGLKETWEIQMCPPVWQEHQQDYDWSQNFERLHCCPCRRLKGKAEVFPFLQVKYLPECWNREIPQNPLNTSSFFTISRKSNLSLIDTELQFGKDGQQSLTLTVDHCPGFPNGLMAVEADPELDVIKVYQVKDVLKPLEGEVIQFQKAMPGGLEHFIHWEGNEK